MGGIKITVWINSDLLADFNRDWNQLFENKVFYCLHDFKRDRIELHKKKRLDSVQLQLNLDDYLFYLEKTK